MNALFFGASDRPLYGVYHTPKARTGRRTGVVLCHPFGQEYMRAHRAFRQLAILLAKAGFHVFRFDYRGTGDSSGEAEELTMAGAAADTALAIEELQDMADVTDVALLGLRLGAATAAQVAETHEDVTHLVLWDAIVDGRTYLEELRAQATVPVGAGRQEAGSLSVMGFPVPAVLQQELASLQLTEGAPARSLRALVVSDTDSETSRTLAGRYSAGSKPADALVAPLPGRWDEVDNWGSAMIPQEAIQSIVGWLTSEVR